MRFVSLTKNYFYMLLIVFFSCKAITAFSAENMSIHRFYDIYTNEQSVLSKEITNNSNATLYLKISVSKVEHAFSKKPKITLLNAMQMQESLMVLTPVLIVPPKTTGVAKFSLPNGHPKKTQFFYIGFNPVTPSINNGFNLTKIQENELKKEKKIDISAHFNIAISTFMAVDAKGAIEQVSVTKHGNNVVLHNTGSSVAMISLSADKEMPSIKAKTKSKAVSGKATLASGKSKRVKGKEKFYSVSGISLLIPGQKIVLPLDSYVGDVTFGVSYNPAKQNEKRYQFSI